MSKPASELRTDYPFCTDSYIACLDDGNWVQNELKPTTTGSWRAEKFATDSNVLVCDHNQGKGSWRFCNDQQIDQLLQEPERPQLRIFVLQPTIHERVLDFEDMDVKTAAAAYDNELGLGSTLPETFVTPETRDTLDISHGALIKILAKYDFAPSSCSHIRGQEQIFGSRIARVGEQITGFDLWYAIRARAYYLHQNLDADLKVTVCTKYDVATGTSVMLFKYRSFNELPTKLRLDLVQHIKDFVMNESTQMVAENPVAPFLSQMFATVQWYRRAARDPRDNIRREEERVHDPRQRKTAEGVDGIVRRLHLTMRSLDQDVLQLGFLLDVIGRLRKHHDIFYAVIKGRPDKLTRDWLYFRVDDELDRLENHIIYMRSLGSDVRTRAQRLLDLIFNLSTLENVRWSENIGKQAMYENAAVKAIAIVSMVFLPGSFVCGVLGTNMFNMPEDGKNLAVSPQWWILPVTIIIATTACMGIFAAWRAAIRKQFRKREEAV